MHERTCPTCDGKGTIPPGLTNGGAARCGSCGRKYNVDRGEDGYADLGPENSYPCQGALNDSDGGCKVRMCSECLKKCDCCGLPACPDHLKPVLFSDAAAGKLGVLVDGDHWCDLCRNAAETSMSDSELEDAVAVIEHQTELERLATLSASGMTLTEAQLYNKHIDKEPL